MKYLLRLGFMTLFLGLLILFPWTESLAAKYLKVAGKVEAVDTDAHPQTIVVETAGPKQRKVSVGCRVENSTDFRIGRHHARLNDFHSGDRVSLAYERVEDGLICQKIGKK